MKKNLKDFLGKDIDLKFLIFLFWKNKIFTFLSILLTFLFFFFFFNPLQVDNKIVVTAKVRTDVPYSVVLKIKSYNPYHDIDIFFQSALSLKVLSYDNFLNFLNEDKNKDFLIFLKKYNLSPNFYFLRNFSEIKDGRIAQYSLKAPIEIDAASFLNNYIVFSKNVLVDEIYQDLKFYINNEIQNNFDALIISKELKIEQPSKELKENEEFNKGQKVLSIIKSQLQSKEKMLSKTSLDWNPFIMEAFQPNKPTKKHNFKMLSLVVIASVVLGLLLTLLIIFFKQVIKKN